MPRSFALGEQFENFIDDEVRSGRYGDAGEVVREALRLLQDVSSSHVERTEELRGMVEEARADPRLIDAHDVFDRLEARYGPVRQA